MDNTKETDKEIPSLFKLGLAGGAIVLGKFLYWIGSLKQKEKTD
jgi:hypothetical protein